MTKAQATLSAWLARQIACHHGNSLREAERVTGLKRATLSLILRGKGLNRDLETLVAIAEAYGVDATDVFRLALNEWRLADPGAR